MITQKVSGRRPLSWVTRGNAVSAAGGLAVGLAVMFVTGLGDAPEEQVASRSVAASDSVVAASPVRPDAPAASATPRRLDRVELTGRSLARTARFGAEPLSAGDLEFAAGEEQAFGALWAVEAQVADGAASSYQGLTARSQARPVRFDTTPLTEVEARFVSEQEWWAAGL